MIFCIYGWFKWVQLECAGSKYYIYGWLLHNGWNNNTVISFLNFISMLEKLFLNMTCWELTRHFMKLKNYTKFLGCKIERMHGGWVVWSSVIKNITLFDNLPLSWQICVSECYPRSVQSLSTCPLIILVFRKRNNNQGS